MSDLPKTIGVLTFNPKISKELLNILKEYFKCMPYMLYAITDSLYILPNTKTIDYVFTNMYRYMQYRYAIKLFRRGMYNYIDTAAFYQLEYGAGNIPACLSIKRLYRKKLEVF